MADNLFQVIDCVGDWSLTCSTAPVQSWLLKEGSPGDSAVRSKYCTVYSSNSTFISVAISRLLYCTVLYTVLRIQYSTVHGRILCTVLYSVHRVHCTVCHQGKPALDLLRMSRWPLKSTVHCTLPSIIMTGHWGQARSGPGRNTKFSLVLYCTVQYTVYRLAQYVVP